MVPTFEESTGILANHLFHDLPRLLLLCPFYLTVSFTRFGSLTGLSPLLSSSSRQRDDLLHLTCFSIIIFRIHNVCNAFSKRVFVFVSIGFRFCTGHPLVCASVRVHQAFINDRINDQLHLDTCTVNSTFEMNLLLVLIGHLTRCLWSLRHRPINWKR